VDYDNKETAICFFYAIKFLMIFLYAGRVATFDKALLFSYTYIAVATAIFSLLTRIARNAVPAKLPLGDVQSLFFFTGCVATLIFFPGLYTLKTGTAATCIFLLLLFRTQYFAVPAKRLFRHIVFLLTLLMQACRPQNPSRRCRTGGAAACFLLQIINHGTLLWNGLSNTLKKHTGLFTGSTINSRIPTGKNGGYFCGCFGDGFYSRFYAYSCYCCFCNSHGMTENGRSIKMIIRSIMFTINMGTGLAPVTCFFQL
jgi:hypothetical protein